MSELDEQAAKLRSRTFPFFSPQAADYIPLQFLGFARRSLGPFKSVPGRSTLTEYFPPGVPGDRSVIVPFWSVRYHGTPARR